MERRNFLRGAALAGTGAALATPAVSGGHGTVLTMVQSWPRGFAVLDDAARYFADFVAQMSDGTLTIDRKAPGELVGALEVYVVYIVAYGPLKNGGSPEKKLICSILEISFFMK